MVKDKAPVFMLRIVAIILGVTLYKHFDFSTFKFQDTPIDFIYLITFVAVIYVLIKDARKTANSKDSK
jgi:hypothetical protein